MADTIGITSITSGGSTLRAAAAAAPTSTDDVAAAANAAPQQGQNPGISPRIVVDPLAGVITQFLNGTGQVESQIPSSAVVAYLRIGLTPEGLSKQTDTTA